LSAPPSFQPEKQAFSAGFPSSSACAMPRNSRAPTSPNGKPAGTRSVTGVHIRAAGHSLEMGEEKDARGYFQVRSSLPAAIHRITASARRKPVVRQPSTPNFVPSNAVPLAWARREPNPAWRQPPGIGPQHHSRLKNEGTPLPQLRQAGRSFAGPKARTPEKYSVAVESAGHCA